jgi:ATP-binding cassette subfamily C (CFTR/MRP) protein 1
MPVNMYLIPCRGFLLTKAVNWLPYSDRILVLSSEGRVSQFGTYQNLASVPGYICNLNLEYATVEEPELNVESRIDSIATDLSIPTGITVENNRLKSRGHRDPRNLLYYINTMGKPSFCLFLLFTTLQCIFIALQRSKVQPTTSYHSLTTS